MKCKSSRELTKAPRVLCFYTTHPVRASFPQSVPRLLAALMAGLATANPAWDLSIVSPPGGDVDGCRSISYRPGFMCTRNSRLARRVLGPSVLNALANAMSTGGARRLGRLVQAPDVVICVRGDDLLLAKKAWPRARRIWMPVSLPVSTPLRRLHLQLGTADLMVVQSPAIYEWLFRQVEHLSFPPPVVIITGPVNLETIQALRESDRKEDLRTALGFRPEELILVHVGARPEKGHKIIELALAMCAPGGREVRLVSLGHSEARSTYCDNGIRLDRLPSVDLTSLYRFFLASDLGVVPTAWVESGPTVLLEMMAAGLPAVASGVGGARHFLSGVVGCLVERPNDVAAWACLLEELIANEGRRAELGKAGTFALLRLGCSKREVALRWSSAIEALLCVGRPNATTEPSRTVHANKFREEGK